MRKEGTEVFVALARDKNEPDYILPKGGVDKGESILAAAKREIREEAGFSDLTLLAELGVIERLNFAKTRWLCTHYFLFLTRQIEVQPTETKRHAPPHWFSLDKLPRLFWPEQQQLLEQNRGLIMEKLKENSQ